MVVNCTETFGILRDCRYTATFPAVHNVSKKLACSFNGNVAIAPFANGVTSDIPGTGKSPVGVVAEFLLAWWLAI